ncbi:acidic proline-rich protein PRP33-like [Peromyscus leucopus]|uniref:acidic proline-rich protein PRP33-like n=1 Tax=Peromyscus leucopus TaxID=10041 RepID=UPI0010A10CB5|nr:acidic proline-rich protein PRP33-like [Peromyscus leucopus]
MLLFINGMAFNVTTLENNSRASSKMLAVLFTAALLVLSSAQSPNEDTESQSPVLVDSAAPESENDPQSDSPPGEEQVSSDDAVENEVNNPQQEQSAEGPQDQSSTLPEDSKRPVQPEGQQHDLPPPEFQHRPPPRGRFSGNKKNPPHNVRGEQRPPLGRGQNVKNLPHRWSRLLA